MVVEQELPEELKNKRSVTRPRGEASLRGHLKREGGGDDDAKAAEDKGMAVEQKKDAEDAGKIKKKEESGSSSYVPREKEKDTQLQYALNFIRGLQVDADTQKDNKAVPN